MPHYKNSYNTDSAMAKDNTICESSDTNCYGRTRLELGLLITLIVVLIIACGSTVLFIIFTTTDVFDVKQINDTSPSCHSHECFKTASEMFERMNIEENPCEDFENFACGRSHVSALKGGLVQGESGSYENFVHGSVLAELERQEKRLSKTQAIGQFYYSKCLDAVLGKDKGLDSLSILLNQYGGWETAEGKNTSFNLSFEKAVLLNQELGFSPDVLLALSLRRDFRNESRLAIYIEPPPFKAALRNLLLKDLKNKDTLSYVHHQVEVAKILGASQKKSARMALDALQLDTDIAILTKNLSEMHKSNGAEKVEILRIKYLSKRIPSVKWTSFISDILSLKNVSKMDEVIILYPEYLEFFNSTVMNLSNRSLSNYFIWKIISESLPYLPGMDFKFLRSLEEDLQGPNNGSITMEEFCSKIVLNDVPYSQEFLSPENTEIKGHLYEPEEIMNSIREQMTEKISNETAWMDGEEAATLVERLRNLKYEIGIPDETISQFYDEFEMNRTDTSFFDSHRRLTAYKRKMVLQTESWRDLTEGHESFDGVIYPSYNVSSNTINFPLVSIEYLYNRKRPNYINYGRIGFITGFLLQHISQDDGKKNSEERYVRSLWSCNITSNERRTKFTSKNVQKDSCKSGGSLRSTYEGVMDSYRSYRKWEDSYSKEDPLVGLNYTPHQLFWVSFTQLLCSNEGHTSSSSDTSVKGPRGINALLKKSIEFSQDWNCSPSGNAKI